MNADDFFERLEVTDDGTFRKKSKVVSEFPPHVTVEIIVALLRCRRQPGDPVRPNPTQDFMKSLGFEVSWKDQMKLKPGQVTILDVRHRTIGKQKWDEWTYILMVDSKGKPLRDHLIISVLSPDGQKLTRMSGRLYK